MMTRRRKLVTVAVALVAVCLGGALAFNAIRRAHTITDVGQMALTEFNLTAIVHGVPLEGAEFDEDSNLWSVRVDKLLWDRGEYPTHSGSDPVPPPVPGAVVDVRVLWADVTPGELYTFALSPQANPDELGREAEVLVWRAHLVLDQTGDPAPGTPEQMAGGFAAMRQVGESGDSVLLGYAIERDADLRSRFDTGRALSGPRLQALAEHYSTPDGARERIEYLASQPAVARQLPTDSLDLDAVNRVGIDPYGISDWSAWHVLVLYDDQAIDEATEYVGLLLDGYGILGPVGVDPRVSFLELEGFGPPAASLSAIRWRGFPAEAVLESERSAYDQANPDAPLAAAEVSPIPARKGADASSSLAAHGGESGVYVVINLRSGQEDTRVVSAKELLAQIEVETLRTPVDVYREESEG